MVYFPEDFAVARRSSQYRKFDEKKDIACVAPDDTSLPEELSQAPYQG